MDSKKEGSSSVSNKLRACLGCSIVKPTSYFKTYGCPNCKVLQLEKSKNLNSTTSFSFRGTIGLVDPQKSWVAKWQRIDSFVPGTYAMTVEGELSEDYIDKLEQDGRVYFNRNQSFELK